MHTKDEKYAQKAVELLKVFFINKNTKMEPHLLYAQAIPGLYSGRGIGIIDTLHLTDIPFAVNTLKESKSLTKPLYDSLVDWFSKYLEWMTSHQYGIDESNEPNNHSICYYVQVAVFSRFTDNTKMLEHCKEMFVKKVFVQMNNSGGFDKELNRTKPYAYSLMVLDNYIILCHLLSDKKDDFWQYQGKYGQGAQKQWSSCSHIYWIKAPGLIAEMSCIMMIILQECLFYDICRLCFRNKRTDRYLSVFTL